MEISAYGKRGQRHKWNHDVTLATGQCRTGEECAPTLHHGETLTMGDTHDIEQSK